MDVKTTMGKNDVALSTQNHHPYMRPSPDGSISTNTSISFLLLPSLIPSLSESRRQPIFNEYFMPYA